MPKVEPPSSPAAAAGRGRPRSLAHELALWVGATSVASMLLFAAVSYGVVIVLENSEPDRDTPEVIEREARTQVGNALLLGGPLCLVLSVIGAVLAARRTTRVLEQIVASATAITPGEPGRRLPLPQDGREEVRSVALAFNGALDRLESGLSLLGQFAAEASHELRTPLTVVAAELDVMLQRSRTAAEWEKAARVCLAEVRHLSRLVDALLAIASAQHRPEEDRVADLERVIAEVVTASGPLAHSRGVSLLARPASGWGPLFVNADADALVGAINAVIENALHYTPTGGEVVLWCERDGTSVSVHVDDSGPGVGDDEAPRIFDAFARGEAGRASANGVGLGLTIARRISERSGGALIVARSPRGGARFSFSLPVLQREGERTTAPSGAGLIET